MHMQGCRECMFSSGGQYFAAVNGATISIYNTYTCENVGNLRGHNGKVGLNGHSWAILWTGQPQPACFQAAGLQALVCVYTNIFTCLCQFRML